MINIEGQNSIQSDEGLLMFMRRDNLDAFWGLSLGKVWSNLGSLKRMRRDYIKGKLFSHILPNLVLFPL